LELRRITYACSASCSRPRRPERRTEPLPPHARARSWNSSRGPRRRREIRASRVSQCQPASPPLGPDRQRSPNARLAVAAAARVDRGPLSPRRCRTHFLSWPERGRPVFLGNGSSIPTRARRTTVAKEDNFGPPAPRTTVSPKFVRKDFVQVIDEIDHRAAAARGNLTRAMDGEWPGPARSIDAFRSRSPSLSVGRCSEPL